MYSLGLQRPFSLIPLRAGTSHYEVLSVCVSGQEALALPFEIQIEAALVAIENQSTRIMRHVRLRKLSQHHSPLSLIVDVSAEHNRTCLRMQITVRTHSHIYAGRERAKRIMPGELPQHACRANTQNV